MKKIETKRKEKPPKVDRYTVHWCPYEPCSFFAGSWWGVEDLAAYKEHKKTCLYRKAYLAGENGGV